MYSLIFTAYSSFSIKNVSLLKINEIEIKNNKGKKPTRLEELQPASRLPLWPLYNCTRAGTYEGRTIRKLMGGGGEGGGRSTEKYSCKGKLNEKKFMHAN